MNASSDVYAQSMLGIFDMGSVEPLRDFFIWAYERSTQEYVAIRQTLAEPDPLWLAHLPLIKDTVRAVGCCSRRLMRKRCWMPVCPPNYHKPSAKPCVP